VQAILKRYF